MLTLGQGFPLREKVVWRGLAKDEAVIARSQIVPSLIGRDCLRILRHSENGA
jgi:hypothetical protein